MDHQAPDILPSVELPRPEQGHETQEIAAQTDTYSEQISSKRVEKGPAGSAPPAQPPASQSIDPQAVPLDPHAAPPTGVRGVAITPQIADDSDLIEKEWVDKAKHIVEHTKHDPYRQNKEMTNMKADYLKKRYNKDIKLSE